jgi:hypothetical protein
VVQNFSQCLEVWGLDDRHHPFQIFHEPSPRLPKVSGPEAGTEEAAKDGGCRFPQSYLDVVTAVRTASEVGPPDSDPSG